MSHSDGPREPHHIRALEGPVDVGRRLGHELRGALAGAIDGVGRLRRHLIESDAAKLEVFELTRALVMADLLVESILREADVRLQEGEPLDVDAYLLVRLTRLRDLVHARVTLNVRPVATGARVLATAEELDAILFGLAESASRAMPAGGDLTVGTGWLDCIPGGAAPDTVWPRRHVRVTVSDTGGGSDEETWQRVISAGAEPGATESIATRVRRLRGSLLLESAPGEGSRIHVCLPAVGQDARPVLDRPAESDDPNETPGG